MSSKGPCLIRRGSETLCRACYLQARWDQRVYLLGFLYALFCYLGLEGSVVTKPATTGEPQRIRQVLVAKSSERSSCIADSRLQVVLKNERDFSISMADERYRRARSTESIRHDGTHGQVNL